MELSWLVLYTGVEDVLSFKGDDEGFMGDVGCTFSGVPACPVEVDVELFALNESSKHMEAFSFCVSSDKDDSIASSKCYNPGPCFSFSGPLISFPRHSLPSNPLSITCYQITLSQGVSRILLDRHITLQAYWLFTLLLSYVIDCGPQAILSHSIVLCHQHPFWKVLSTHCPPQ